MKHGWMGTMLTSADFWHGVHVSLSIASYPLGVLTGLFLLEVIVLPPWGVCVTVLFLLLAAFALLWGVGREA